MSDRVPPENLPQGAPVLAMIGNVLCVRARVSRDVNWNWVAQPTPYALRKIRIRIDLAPWRYLEARDEGTYWVRGWSQKAARALMVAAGLARSV